MLALLWLCSEAVRFEVEDGVLSLDNSPLLGPLPRERSERSCRLPPGLERKPNVCGVSGAERGRDWDPNCLPAAPLHEVCPVLPRLLPVPPTLVLLIAELCALKLTAVSWLAAAASSSRPEVLEAPAAGRRLVRFFSALCCLVVAERARDPWALGTPELLGACLPPL